MSTQLCHGTRRSAAAQLRPGRHFGHPKGAWPKFVDPDSAAPVYVPATGSSTVARRGFARSHGATPSPRIAASRRRDVPAGTPCDRTPAHGGGLPMPCLHLRMPQRPLRGSCRRARYTSLLEERRVARASSSSRAPQLGVLYWQCWQLARAANGYHASGRCHLETTPCHALRTSRCAPPPVAQPACSGTTIGPARQRLDHRHV